MLGYIKYFILLIFLISNEVNAAFIKIINETSYGVDVWVNYNNSWHLYTMKKYSSQVIYSGWSKIKRLQWFCKELEEVHNSQGQEWLEELYGNVSYGWEIALDFFTLFAKIKLIDSEDGIFVLNKKQEEKAQKVDGFNHNKFKISSSSY